MAERMTQRLRRIGRVFTPSNVKTGETLLNIHWHSNIVSKIENGGVIVFSVFHFQLTFTGISTGTNIMNTKKTDNRADCGRQNSKHITARSSARSMRGTGRPKARRLRRIRSGSCQCWFAALRGFGLRLRNWWSYCTPFPPSTWRGDQLVWNTGCCCRSVERRTGRTTTRGDSWRTTVVF